MKIKAYGYEHTPGISLQVFDETEVEETLLSSLWRFGKLQRVHDGYAITVAMPGEEELKNGKN